MPAITLADQADITHSQTYPACGHCSAIHADGDLGTGQDSPRVHAQADLAADQRNCLPTAYSEQWLEYVTEERRSSTPARQSDRVGRSVDTRCRNTSAESSG